MSIADRLLERAISLSKAGKKLDARQILVEVLRQDPRNETAWLWYVDTFSDRDGKIAALRQMLEIFPNHETAAGMLAVLESPASANVTPVPASPESQQFIRILAPLMLLIGICGLVFACIGLIDRASNAIQLSELKGQNSALQNQVSDLSGRINSLNLQYQELQSANQRLQADYQNLQAVALLPPYISVSNRKMLISFIKTDETRERWEVDFQTLEDELYRGRMARDAIDYDDSMWIKLKNTSTGETYRVVDMTKFVDPSSFRQVIPTLYKEAPSDDAFVREVWNIVTQLALYSKEITETPRYPLETFLAGGGDCEDTAILYASMLLAAPVHWDVELVYLDIDHPMAPQGVNHVIVRVNTGSQDYLVDTTEHQVMLPYTEGVYGWYFTVH